MKIKLERSYSCSSATWSAVLIWGRYYFVASSGAVIINQEALIWGSHHLQLSQWSMCCCSSLPEDGNEQSGFLAIHFKGHIIITKTQPVGAVTKIWMHIFERKVKRNCPFLLTWRTMLCHPWPRSRHWSSLCIVAFSLHPLSSLSSYYWFFLKTWRRERE